MDLVYIVRPGDINEDLRYSLRSIAKYAPDFDKIWIVGYKPNWVGDNVFYIPVNQKEGKFARHLNTTNNILTACNNDSVSGNFILMNDDFILTRPIRFWKQSLNKVRNSIKEQIKLYRDHNLSNSYCNAFSACNRFISELSGNESPMNYELHIPMIINKKKFIDLLTRPEVIDFINTHPVFLKRSLYGNCYCKYTEQMTDVKIQKDTDNFQSDWLSVFDDWIGNSAEYPLLNMFLGDKFGTACIYEKY